MPRSILLVLALFAISAPALAQRGVQQGGLTLPAFTDEQRWARVATHAINFYVTGIAAAKARGQTAEEYGRVVGDMFAPSWGAAGSGSAIRVARGWYFNFIAFPQAQPEILSANDTTVTLRYRRFYVPNFGAQRTLYGVTLDEYERATAEIGARITQHLGLSFQTRVDGEWNVVTISGRGNVAVLDFPRGTYVPNFTARDLADNPQWAASYESSYLPNGRFVVRRNGEVIIEGNYDVARDQIVFRNERGATACPDSGTYRWTVNTTGNLSFGRLSDECDARFRYLTGRPFTRK